MQADITQGEIHCKYTGTILEKTGYIISTIALIGFAIYVVIIKKKSCEEKTYERKI